MFRSMGLDEKIAGNMRDKQRALNAAETAEQYAENWLSLGNGSNGVACTAVVNGNANRRRFARTRCSQSVPNNDVTSYRWTMAGTRGSELPAGRHERR